MRIRRRYRVHILIAACVAMISLFACQPVIAIGWREILFVFILVAIVFGPPIYRFIRKIEDFRKHEKTDRH
jgi:membrane protein YdbS with pleckstrin-like domain